MLELESHVLHATPHVCSREMCGTNFVFRVGSIRVSFFGCFICVEIELPWINLLSSLSFGPPPGQVLLVFNLLINRGRLLYI